MIGIFGPSFGLARKAELAFRCNQNYRMDSVIKDGLWEEKVESEQKNLTEQHIVYIFKKRVSLNCFEFLSSSHFKIVGQTQFLTLDCCQPAGPPGKVLLVKRWFLKISSPT